MGSDPHYNSCDQRAAPECSLLCLLDTFMINSKEQQCCSVVIDHLAHKLGRIFFSPVGVL